MSEKRKYTREFKLEAVRLVQKGNSASRVAEQLGIRSRYAAPLEATSRS